MKPKIIVLSLGPGAPELMTLQTVQALKEARKLVLRTRRHPVAAWLTEQGLSFSSLDDFYDRYEDFDSMHAAMADWLWNAAGHNPLCYGVMNPAQDGSVRALKASRPESGELIQLPGLSVLNGCEAALPPETVLSGNVRVFSATDYLSSPQEPMIDLWIMELDSALLAGDVKLKLNEVYADNAPVFFFPPSEKARRKGKWISLCQLDGQKAYDHTTAFFLAGSSFLQRNRFSFEDLRAITARLRAPDGCPWDRVQTHASLTPYMVEEAWEAVSAIEEDDMDHLADELGDVLFQVFIHASIAVSFGEFTMTDVLTHICQKMIQRHPHVFRQAHAETAEEIAFGWEAIKREETGSKTVGETLNDVSASLPSLKYSIKMFKKLAQLPALRRDPETIAEEIRTLSASLLEKGTLQEEVMASLLMKCTELCYRQNQDAEILLHRAVDRMKGKYQRAENMIFMDEKSPESLTFQQLRVYLEAVERESE